MMNKVPAKKYEKPSLCKLGSVADLTRGQAGSGADGQGRKAPGQG